MEVTLPWPPSALSPNTRQHWSKLAKAKKEYRKACGWAVISAGIRRIEAEKLHVTLEFYAPTRRAFDLDNLLARMKSGLDGLADVIGVDDSKWSLTIKKADTIGGMVKVSINKA